MLTDHTRTLSLSLVADGASLVNAGIIETETVKLTGDAEVTRSSRDESCRIICERRPMMTNEGRNATFWRNRGCGAASGLGPWTV